jgi:uncharacterized membrane protein YfcA
MEFPVAITPLAVLSGFVVGLLVGVTGVGGGSLMTPILILLFGTHASTAVGTDLLYAAATKSAGSIAHGLGKTVDWSITLRLAAGSLPGVVLTIVALYLAGIRGDSSSRLITANPWLVEAVVVIPTSTTTKPFVSSPRLTISMRSGGTFATAAASTCQAL